MNRMIDRPLILPLRFRTIFLSFSTEFVCVMWMWIEMNDIEINFLGKSFRVEYMNSIFRFRLVIWWFELLHLPLSPVLSHPTTLYIYIFMLRIDLLRPLGKIGTHYALPIDMNTLWANEKKVHRKQSINRYSEN